MKKAQSKASGGGLRAILTELPYLAPLDEFRKKAHGFSDLLPYALKIDDRTILNKDGSLMVSFKYQAEDLASASRIALAAVAERMNTAVIGLGDNWMLHFHAIRRPAVGYPTRSAFVDATSKIIDEVRRVQFERAGQHYVNDFIVDLTYLPPVDAIKRLESLLIVGDEKKSAEEAFADTLAHFDEKLRQFVNILEHDIHLEPLTIETIDGEDGPQAVDHQLAHVVQCATARQMRPPKLDSSVDVSSFVSCKPLRTGLRMRMGDDLIAVLVVREMGAQSYPGMFDFLNTLPNEYRVSWRFIAVEREKAISQISKEKNRWFVKRRGVIKALDNREEAFSNNHAVNMASDAAAALDDLHARAATYGYFTMSITFWEPIGERKESAAWSELSSRVETVAAELHQRGCQTFFERENSLEAFLGTLPGIGAAMVRRPMLASRNLADYIPLTGVWTGSMNAPCPFYPEGSPPLAYVATNGSTPLALNLHVDDVGHFTIAGPSGMGKSVLLGFLLAQHRRYPNARQIVLDVGRSHYVLAKAVGGVSYDVGADTSLRFAPLAHIGESTSEMRWAASWVTSLIAAQGVEVKTRHAEIFKAVALLANAGPPYSLTRLASQIYLTPEEQRAIEVYTVSGQYDILDGEEDHQETASFVHYELGAIAQADQRLRRPLLEYLFHRIERLWDGSPTLLVLEEVWKFLDDPESMEKIKDWLKTARKFNVAVGFATQSVSDYTESPIADAIINMCMTRFFLSNPEAKTQLQRDTYRALGLTDWQMTLVTRLHPKSEYFMTSPLGRRAFTLNLTPIELAFIGVSNVDTVKQLARIIEDQERRVTRGIADLTTEIPWQANWLNQYTKGSEKAAWVEYWLELWRKAGGWTRTSESLANERAALAGMHAGPSRPENGRALFAI